MKTFGNWALFSVFFILLSSCNIYAPLASKSSVDDYLEEAQKCLHDGDYACAITNYTALPDGELKSEKLCNVYLAKGGVKLNVLLSIINQSDSSVLGDFANALIPWTSEKQADLETAKTNCDGYKVSTIATTDAGKTAVLLDTVAKFAHCAILMAKADQLGGSSNTDTTCTTAGNNSGTLTQSDIGNSDGDITSVGMCKTDVTTCRTDIDAVDETNLTTAGFAAIATALSNVPAAINSGSAAVDAAAIKAVRSAIRTTAASD